MIDAVTLAQQLIKYPSITPATGAIFDHLERVLRDLGFTCTRLTFDKPDPAPVENLFAHLGSGGPHLGFIGHVDVVPPGDLNAWSHPPFEGVIEDRVFYGRGAADMKGAVAAFIAAVAAMLPLKVGQVSLLITGDEEGIGENGIKQLLPWVAAQQRIADAYLVGEPTSENRVGDMVKTGRRGSLTAMVTAQGVQGHTAYPHLADNPIPRLVDFLHAVQHYVLDQGTDQFDPSNLQITSIDVGNPTTNIIPAQAKACLGIRFNTHHSGKSLEQWLRARAAEHNVTLTTHISAEPFLSQQHPLHDLVREVITEVTGTAPTFSTTGGTSDARFAHVYAPVIEVGLVNRTIHKIDECVPIEDLQKLRHIYQEILCRNLSS